MNQNPLKKKERWYLTLIFSIVVFLGFVALAAFIFIMFFILSRTGVLPELNINISSSHLVVIAVVIVSIFIGFGFSILFSFILTGPVRRYTKAMHELASGNYKTRISYNEPFASFSTVKGITNSFNTLAEELDNTEILRSDFVNNFSHEFKTPIVSIAGFAKLLKRGNLTEEQRNEYTDIIEEESLRLSDLATNVMDLTKIENQNILTGVTRYNLSEQIRGAVLLMEEKWNSKNIVPSLRFGEHYICANEERLKQVWINLLDNAIKFAPEGGEVGARIEENKKATMVTVYNSGSVIDEKDIGRIFNKFYQADRSHSSKGYGIGLAIVKGIVDLHLGTVSVRSEDGKTFFTVTIPDLSDRVIPAASV